MISILAAELVVDLSLSKDMKETYQLINPKKTMSFKSDTNKKLNGSSYFSYPSINYHYKGRKNVKDGFLHTKTK